MLRHNQLSNEHGDLKPSLPDNESPAEVREDSRLFKIASRVMLGAGVLFLLVAGSLFFFRQSYDDRIYPGVIVAGVEIGGLTEAEAREALDVKASELLNTRAYFDALDQHWGPTLEDLGVMVNVDVSLEEAFAVGRADEGVARVGAVLESLRQETWLPLHIEISQDDLALWAMDVNEQLGIFPRNAELYVENGQVNIVEEANGTVVDVPALQSLLTKSLATFSAPTSSLPLVDSLPSTYSTDFAEVAAQLEQALSQSATVAYDDRTWSISPEIFGQFVGVSVDPSLTGPESVSLDVDTPSFARWLRDEISPSINRDPTNATVAWNGAGGVVITANGVEGRRLLPTALAETTIEAFFNDHAQVSIPIQIIAPEVNSGNLDQLGITTRLGAGSSNFSGSEDSRAINIQAGVNLLNGTLVPPRGEFSFNRSIGIISTDSGFVESQVIDGERIGRDIGGGVCQVSTTVFRAALYSGMPITEWWFHRYRLGFYELDGWTPGLDASILQPEGDPFGGGDFRFRNPSDGWLLIESYVEWPRVYVIIYGPDLGYKVEVSEPVFGTKYEAGPPVELIDYELPAGSIVQTEWALEGMDISYYRTVYDGSGAVVLSDPYHVHFAPRGNVYKVSADMQGFSPGG